MSVSVPLRGLVVLGLIVTLELDDKHFEFPSPCGD